MLLVALAQPAPARAHAELGRSDPAVDAIVEDAPTRVTLWFTEEPELRFSEIEILDRNRRRVDRGDLRPDPLDRLALSIGLGETAPGTYTVLWKVLSAVDGHVTRGAFAFTVGLDQTPSGLALEGEDGSSTATPERVAVRLLTYVGFALLTGFFTFAWWVLLPALAAAGVRGATAALLLRRLTTLALAGWGLALVAAVASLLMQASEAYGVSAFEAAGSPAVAIATSTRFGALWWVRIGLLAAAAALLVLGRRRGWSTPILAVGACTGAGILLAHALGSHAAAVVEGAGLAVAFDWLHLAAVAAWIGGLGHLLVSLKTLTRNSGSSDATRLGALMVPRFSTVAILCVTSLILTGVYQSWLHAGGLDALIATDYGHALLVKLGLILPLLALGAVNLLVFRPQLQAAGHSSAPQTSLVPLGHSVTAEVALAVSIFVVVGVLTNLEPARSAILAQGVEQSIVADGVRATLRVQPGLPGPNRFDISLTSRDGRPITDAEKVALRFIMLTMNMGESELVAYPREDGHYVAQGGPLVMDGPWRIEAVIRRPGMEDVRPAFDVAIASVSTGSTLNAAPVGQSALFVGVELLLVGFGALAFAVWAAPRRRRLLPIVVPAGIVAILAGSLVAGSGAAALSAAVRNPIPPTVESVQVGRETYADRCAVCHGASGRGDGPAAVTLQPRPADFRAHLAAGHTDAQLFDWLSNGFPGTAMPAFRNELSVEERWHVLNYIKASFGPGRSQAVGGVP